MVDITPFRALRFREERAGALDTLIAPPYDVISPEHQAALYAKSPHNIVRVDFTKSEPGEAEDAKYTRAAGTLAAWMAEGVLAQDGDPAYYVLAQTFTGPDGVERTRTGFFSRARLSAWDDGPILPHERTLRGPKVDRLKLMRATRQNLSPIFGAYEDKDGAVGAALARVQATRPIAQAGMDKVKNVLWRVDSAADRAEITRALAPKKLYIADGHHRYETGLAYRDERRQERGQVPAGELPGYESILMFASAVEDPGMVIFPTHRLVHSMKVELDRLRGELGRFFTLADAPADAAAAQRALAEAGKRGNAFLLAAKSGRWLLGGRPEAPWASVPSLPAHPALSRLDVAVLHGVVLEHLLGITAEAQATQANLRYSKDWSEAFEAPHRQADVELAVLMNPTKIEEVIRVAESGQVMPQKSTFFYPKIPSGLVLCPLD